MSPWTFVLAEWPSMPHTGSAMHACMHVIPGSSLSQVSLCGPRRRDRVEAAGRQAVCRLLPSHAPRQRFGDRQQRLPAFEPSDIVNEQAGGIKERVR